MRMVLFGPPGVGKGSQATFLSEREGLAHISTGVILRAAIKAGTPVGEEARAYISAGRLVPGVVVRKLAEDAIASHAYDNFVLDGYPRTIEQSEWLDAFLEMHHSPLHAVVSLQVPDDVIVNRLSKRRINVETGENFHLDYKPPPADADPKLIIQRPDDQPGAIRRRLDVYRNETSPVEHYYEDRGLLFRIDGVGEFEEVYQRIRAVREQVSHRFELGRAD